MGDRLKVSQLAISSSTSDAISHHNIVCIDVGAVSTQMTAHDRIVSNCQVLPLCIWDVHFDCHLQGKTKQSFLRQQKS